MLIRKIDEIPHDEEYVHQLKWDGHRALFHYDEGHFRIFTREQNECTLQYPEFRSLKLPVKNCILDDCSKFCE
jgi:DNA ligase-1